MLKLLSLFCLLLIISCAQKHTPYVMDLSKPPVQRDSLSYCQNGKCYEGEYVDGTLLWAKVYHEKSGERVNVEPWYLYEQKPRRIHTQPKQKSIQRSEDVNQLPESPIKKASNLSDYRSKESILSVIKKNQVRLKYFYNNALQRLRIQGKVVIKFTITPSGKISRIIPLEVTFKYDEEFIRNIIKEVASWEFEPIARGNTIITVPFSFAP